jgi:hypothetical protein
MIDIISTRVAYAGAYVPSDQSYCNVEMTFPVNVLPLYDTDPTRKNQMDYSSFKMQTRHKQL